MIKYISNSDKRQILICEARNGQNSLVVNNISIHSKYNPGQEALKFIETYVEQIKISNTIVVYGIGLGYHIMEILKYAPEKSKIYVFDLDFELIGFLKDNGFMNEIKGDKRVVLGIYTSENEFYTNFSKKLEIGECLVIYKPSLRALPDKYDRFKKRILQFEQARYKMEKYGDMMRKNSISNMNDYDKTISSFYKDCSFVNEIVCVISAGPSLDSSIKYIKKIRNRVKIFCVGTALKKLIKNDIRPDMFCIIDPLVEPIYEQIRGYEDIGVPMCFLSTASSMAVEKYRGPRYIFFNSDNAYDHMIIQTDKTVACALIDITLRGNPSQIILVGQDLAFMNGESHCSDTIHDKKDNSISFKGGHQTKDVRGNMITTSSEYLNFKWSIENIIKGDTKNRFINCSEGAAIEGAKYMNIEAFVNKMLENDIDE